VAKPEDTTTKHVPELSLSSHSVEVWRPILTRHAQRDLLVLLR
jgi:hypothetical protein